MTDPIGDGLLRGPAAYARGTRWGPKPPCGENRALATVPLLCSVNRIGKRDV